MDDALTILSLILGIVALIITVIGFFASLKFYRDGVTLQDAATKTMISISERTNNIQNQIDGIVEKTLDVALDRGNQVSREFQDIEEQLQEVRKKVLAETNKELQSIGKEEKVRIQEFIEKQFKVIADQVHVTKENTEELLSSHEDDPIPVAKFQLRVLGELRQSNRRLSASEIAGLLGMEEQVIAKSLERLVEKGILDILLDARNIPLYQISSLELPTSDQMEQVLSNTKKDAEGKALFAHFGIEFKRAFPDFEGKNYGYRNLLDLMRSYPNVEIIDNFVGGLNHPYIRKK